MPIPAMLATLAPYLVAAGGTALGSYLGSKGQQPGNQQIANKSANQLGLQDEAIRQAMATLKSGSGGFAPIENQAREKFNEQTMLGIAQSYTNAFGPNNRGGNALNQITTSAKRGFEGDLAAMKANFQNNQLSSLLNIGQQPRFDTIHTPNSGGAFNNALAGLGPLLGASIPYLSMQGQQGQGTGQGQNMDQDTLALILQLLTSQGGNNLGGNSGGGGFANPQVAGPAFNTNLGFTRQAGF